MMPDCAVPAWGHCAPWGSAGAGTPVVNNRAINHNKFDALTRVSLRQGPDRVLIPGDRGGCRWWPLGWPGVQFAGENTGRGGWERVR